VDCPNGALTTIINYRATGTLDRSLEETFYAGVRIDNEMNGLGKDYFT
jgi:hypothetical protein